LNRLTAATAFIAVAISLGGCTQGERGGITLRYKFEPGLQLTYEQISKRCVKTIESDSTVKEVSTVFKMTVVQTVDRLLNDSTAEIVEVANWKYENPAKDDSSAIDTIEQKRELVLQVQTNGKVRDVKFKAGEDHVRIRYIKNYYEQGLPVFPTQEVTPEYTWTQTAKVVLPGEPIEASMTYKVTSLVREAGYDCAVIECDGTMIIPFESNPKDTIQTSGLDRIKSTGVLYFAYKEGMVVQQRERWQIDRDRRKTYDGKTKEYQEAVEIDIDFILKGRIIVDSLAL